MTFKPTSQQKNGPTQDDVLFAAFCNVDMEVDACRQLLAYNLPGVLLGSPDTRWAKIKPIYDKLVLDYAANVRRTLACSIGAIASLLNPSIAEKDLFSPFLTLLNDEDDEYGTIRLGTVRQSYTFMKTLSSVKRSVAFESLIKLRKSCMSALTPARDIRMAIATQLELLAELKLPMLVDETLTLCQDDVHVVRLAACHALGKVLMAASAMEQFQGLNLLCTWAGDSNYCTRLNFANAALSCMQVANGKTTLGGKLVPLLKALKTDRVISVKLAAERALND